MFAVIKTGGKQYKVSENSIIKIDKIEGEPGKNIHFTEISMMGEMSKPSFIGTPNVHGASVTATIIKQLRGEKIIVFKKIRRQNHRRKNGHRQELTEIKILDIRKEA